MFYQTDLPQENDREAAAALVSLTPSESKRLIAKGVAALPQVKQAMARGLVIIARGTSNTYVAEELLGNRIEPKCEYLRGCIVNGELGANTRRGGGPDLVLRDGKLIGVRPQDAIKEFSADDVFLKGASAVDASGEAGVLAAGSDGGTIGYALTTLIARRAHLIVPVGLEKLVPNVAEASRRCGVFRFKYSTGLPCALVPLVNAEVVTEVQALAILARVRATHVASGGIGGSEGAVVLALEGSDESVERAFGIVKSVKGEPPVPAPAEVIPSAASLGYDPKALHKLLAR